MNKCNSGYATADTAQDVDIAEYWNVTSTSTTKHVQLTHASTANETPTLQESTVTSTRESNYWNYQKFCAFMTYAQYI